MGRTAPPRLSVVLPTWNDQAGVAACLEALARQTTLDFEAIVVDAASTDGTVGEVCRVQPGLPYPLRLVVPGAPISIGEARDRGAELAHAPRVAFLSADAEPGLGWAEAALQGAGR